MLLPATSVGPPPAPLTDKRAADRPPPRAARFDPPAYPRQRALDWAVAVVAGLAVLPVVAAAAALVRATSRGPAFYTQVRSGAGGRPFRILKLRTMYDNCEAQTGAVWASARDPRVTAVGRVLRALHIDELPQLWNVLRGEMSVVGPRPERPEIVAHLEAVVPGYRDRMAVRPGVTGLAQIQLPADTDVRNVAAKLVYDRLYMAGRGVGLDVRVMLGTGLYLAGVPYRRVAALAGLPVPAGRAEAS
jgi:lipopolysaccharide/colanic/teichoic acid biosynthesis glycosyltransferase